jgi:hypothetical protein
MAIAFGASLGSTTGGGASTKSLTSLSISGSNLAIIAVVRTENTARTVSSVVWDNGAGGASQSFTQLGSYLDLEAGNHRLSFWYLVNPTSTNSRILATISASDVMYLEAVYYTGVAQTSTFTTAVNSTDTASPGSASDTSDTDGSWHIAIGGSANAGMTPSTGATERVEVSNNTGIYDSNATVANTVSHTFNWTWGTGNAGWITAMMRPIVASGPANLKSLDGNLKANIKSIDGNLIANVKSFDGNS